MVARNWGYKYPSCLTCDTIERVHKARGRCTKCHPSLLKEYCSLCEEKKVISRRLNKDVVCTNCNKKYFTPIKKRKCSICEKIARIDKVERSLSICTTCYKKFYYKQPKKKCTNCQEEKNIRAYNKGKPYCDSCYCYTFYTKPKFICGNCGKLAKTSAIIQNKRYCHTCYKELRKEHYIRLYLNWKGNNKDSALTDQDIRSIFDRDKSCVYCGNKGKLSFDHIIPISKGGKSNLNNLVLACMPCNLSKNKSDVIQWCKRKSIFLPPIICELLERQKI